MTGVHSGITLSASETRKNASKTPRKQGVKFLIFEEACPKGKAPKAFLPRPIPDTGSKDGLSASAAMGGKNLVKAWARNSGSWSSEEWEETFPSGMTQVEFKDGFGSFGGTPLRNLGLWWEWLQAGLMRIEGTGIRKNLKSGIVLNQVDWLQADWVQGRIERKRNLPLAKWSSYESRNPVLPRLAQVGIGWTQGGVFPHRRGLWSDGMGLF